MRAGVCMWEMQCVGGNGQVEDREKELIDRTVSHFVIKTNV